MSEKGLKFCSRPLSARAGGNFRMVGVFDDVQPHRLRHGEKSQVALQFRIFAEARDLVARRRARRSQRQHDKITRRRRIRLDVVKFIEPRRVNVRHKAAVEARDHFRRHPHKWLRHHLSDAPQLEVTFRPGGGDHHCRQNLRRRRSVHLDRPARHPLRAQHKRKMVRLPLEFDLRAQPPQGVEQPLHWALAHRLVAVERVFPALFQAERRGQKTRRRARVADVDRRLGLGNHSAAPLDADGLRLLTRADLEPQARSALTMISVSRLNSA